MKHILPILTAALVCMGGYTALAQDNSEPAAFSYKVLPTPYTNQVNQGTDWEYYVIKVTEGNGRLYVMDYINNLQDSNSYHDGHWGQNESIQAQGIIKYGWYDASNMQVTDTLSADDVHWMDVNEQNRSIGQSFNDPYNSNNTTPIERYKYDLGENFKEGDVIGIAMMKADGTFVGSYSVNNATNSTRYGASADAYAAYYNGNWWSPAAKAAMPVAELTFESKLNNGSEQMRYLLQGEGVAITGGGDETPVGGPLPGGLQITLIAGLFGLGFWYIRRRNATVA